MKTTAEIVEMLRDFKAHSAEKYGIMTLGLFGSVARGEQREGSDIDVCVKLRETSYHTLMDIQEDLEKLFRTRVDVITLHDTMRALFRRNIEKDAIYI
ncbi:MULTISPECIES: nucleotidyltransferase family protein [Parabacteroides]|jgi:hypothetical protein|uniref:Polymerase beta nucleotidyltransferase domain-containing protein n=1 Tax=Parabacteroides faecis TaxID=1217282 RepID=A0ABR6KI95_9BACT|nr:MULTISPECIES: nucleotidyltransferase family protein [Parabacteroides]MBB4621202.1 hypothetical protein [Parabacteroides faecis]RHR40102.1 toxin [Parabacteroides sp. AF18-52]GGJ88449.1 nucleotidyltransferase [Parabacteroides faecis]